MSDTRRAFLLRASLAAAAPILGCRAPGVPAASGADHRPEEEPTMPIQFSSVLPTRARSIGDAFSVRSLELADQRTSPVLVVDDFQVSGRPFGPHPHAGFAAITYVFPDSEGSLRNRDSLGNHLVLAPGGICWTHAGSGAQHEEIPADARPLRGLQVFVNLSARNKLSEPRVHALTAEQVPEWRSSEGDRVRVVVGSFEGARSPLVPMEPFTFLDVALRRQIDFTLEEGHTALVYVRAGDVVVRGEAREQALFRGQGLALFLGSGPVRLEASSPAHVVILSGRELHEPVVMRGPFIMNEPSQIDAALERYRAGRMGHLAPFREG